MPDVTNKSSHSTRMIQKQYHKPPNSEQVNTVYISTDYDMFVFNQQDKNRVINYNHVTELKVKIVSEGQIEPILVRPLGNGKYEIVQGQHRYTAAKELGIPIKFIVDVNLTIEDMPRCHTTHLNFTNEDWLNRWLSDGIQDYQIYKTFRETHKLNHDSVVTLLGGESMWDKHGEMKRKFREGTFRVTHENLDWATQFVNSIYSLSEHCDPVNMENILTDKKFHIAIRTIWDDKNWNKFDGFKTLKSKYDSKLPCPIRISRQFDVIGYVRNIEDIFNYNRKRLSTRVFFCQ